MVMLLSAVHEDHIQLVATADTPATAWKSLADTYDRDTGHSTIRLFRSLTTLRYRDGKNLRQHINEFHQLWMKMQRRCRTSTQHVAKGLRLTFDSDEAKGSYFLNTLPDTMEHLVDNLETQGLTSFAAVQPKMMDIADKHSLDTQDGAAYYTSTATKNPKGTRRDGKPTSKGNRPILGNTQSFNTSANECTWCKKHNFTFVGHVYTNCRKLKEHKNKQKHHSAHQANESTTQPDDDTDPTAFAVTTQMDRVSTPAVIDLRSPSPTPPTVCSSQPNRKGVIDDTDEAYLVTLPTSQSNTPCTWIFDTGASRHMSGYLEDFSTMAPKQGAITIAGGHKIPIEGIGSVTFLARLPDGATRRTELTNVLYSRELRNTRLFSWPYVRYKGFSMSATGNHIYLHDTTDCILWARCVNNGMQIQTDSDNTAQASFVTYTEFHD